MANASKNVEQQDSLLVEKQIGTDLGKTVWKVFFF
jgi:hypothetical protein